jgi:hypothetical protein
MGWTEPAATNAPVEHEPVQPVLRMNILPAHRDFFFHLLFASKFSASRLLPTPSYLPPTKPTPPPTSTLLPTTYQPHPPSLHHESSKNLEQLWSGNWSCCCRAGVGVAGVRPARVGARPTRPRKGKMLMFFFLFFLFFCLKKA